MVRPIPQIGSDKPVAWYICNFKRNSRPDIWLTTILLSH